MAYSSHVPMVAVTEKSRILINIRMGHFSPAEIQELIEGLQLLVRTASPAWAPADSAIVRPDAETRSKVNGILLRWAQKCRLVAEPEPVPRWF